MNADGDSRRRERWLALADDFRTWLSNLASRASTRDEDSLLRLWSPGSPGGMMEEDVVVVAMLASRDRVQFQSGLNSLSKCVLPGAFCLVLLQFTSRRPPPGSAGDSATGRYPAYRVIKGKRVYRVGGAVSPPKRLVPAPSQVVFTLPSSSSSDLTLN